MSARVVRARISILWPQTKGDDQITHSPKGDDADAGGRRSSVFNDAMRRPVLLLVLFLATSLGWQNAALADVISKPDPKGDAPTRLDITNVTYRNTSARISVRLRVHGLERKGRAELVVGEPRTDVSWIAIASIRSDGSMRKRFVERGNVSETPQKCDFRAQWYAAKNYISISIPRECVPEIDSKFLYLASNLSAFEEDARDDAPPAKHLAQD